MLDTTTLLALGTAAIAFGAAIGGVRRWMDYRDKQERLSRGFDRAGRDNHRRTR